MVSLTRILWIALALTAGQAAAQRNEPVIDVEHYVIQAEINPQTQELAGDAAIRFRAVAETRYVPLDLHNSLTVDEALDEAGVTVAAGRQFENHTVRLTLDNTLEPGQVKTLRVKYRGRLNGREESPVFGITFAAIHGDHAFLMYPARWFPVSGYSTDRFTADMKITVPSGYRVLGSGLETRDESVPGKVTYSFQFSQPSFPGSIAVVKGDPQRVESEGAATLLFFRGGKAQMAGAYGEEMGRVMKFLTGAFGLAPQSSLALVETEDGAPNGYTAPGLLFLSPRAIGDSVDSRLLVNQVSRQWWGVLCSAADRNHLWLTNGMARYAEIMWIEQTQSPAAADAEMANQFVEALTMDEHPLSQSEQLEDYSPEFWAATAGKGSAILRMLLLVIGPDNFRKLLVEFPDAHAWKSFHTRDFREAAEKLSGKPLEHFFNQWIESTGAPEFDADFTIYRTKQGFRVMGQIKQDMETFRMPLHVRIETEGNPEDKEIEVVGPITEFVFDTFGKPIEMKIDPENEVLRYSDEMRVAVAIRRGELLAQVGEYAKALEQYKRALEVNPYSSFAHYRIAEAAFEQRDYQGAANAFKEALNGDLEPSWTEVWAHINLGKIYDVAQQRERAVNEYNLAIRTKDNTQGALDEAQRYIKQPFRQPSTNNI